MTEVPQPHLLWFRRVLRVPEPRVRERDRRTTLADVYRRIDEDLSEL